MENQMNNRQLYFLINPTTNEPFYVGIGLPGRSKVHISQAKNAKFIKFTDLKKITILKMLHKNITPIDKIIYENLTKKEAQAKEIALINKLGRLDLGTGILTNRTSGGEWINDSPRTDEWIQNMSRSQKMAQNTPEAKRKKSMTLKGLKRSRETIERIRASQLVDSVRQKNSISKIGGKNPMARKCVFMGIEYGSVVSASNAAGISGYLVKKHHAFSYV